MIFSKTKVGKRRGFNLIKTAFAVVIVTLHFSANAQLIGTIGIGHINYGGAKQTIRSPQSVISTLNVDLNKALLKTRKFTVLEKPQLIERLGVQGLNLQGFYEKTYTSTELLQVGLDYILTANVTELSINDKTLAEIDGSSALVEIEFTLLGVADATKDFSSSVSAKASLASDTAESNAAGLISQALSRSVDLLVNQVISTLHPIRVMRIDEKSIITLNYGKGVLQAGDTILVYPASQEIKVKPNGDALNQAIATLQVISVEKKFASAQALDGYDRLERGQKGLLLMAEGS